jgi:hypothetical protein
VNYRLADFIHCHGLNMPCLHDAQNTNFINMIDTVMGRRLFRSLYGRYIVLYPPFLLQ